MMKDELKFIFTTLTKIPIIILVVYAVFNLFAFSLSYFKILGCSYVVMQTAMENNYIPDQELNTLNAYLDSIESEMLEDTEIVCMTEKGANKRCQYGEKVTVTVSAHYRFIWPLMPSEQKSNGVAANGIDGSGMGTQLSQAQLEAKREEMADNDQNNIVITYTVPGLKYYPDMN